MANTRNTARPSGPFNGWNSWNSWNVNLWIDSDYNLQRTAETVAAAVYDHTLPAYTMAHGVDVLKREALQAFPNGTPDGGRVTAAAIREGLRGYRPAKAPAKLGFGGLTAA